MDHEHTCVTTLTYDDENLPATLSKRHLQLWFKRIRQQHGKKLRYFACGEYGDKYGRPHYHAIIFGMKHEPRFPKDTHHPLVADTWTLGLTHTDLVSIQAINYVTHYTAKKLGWPKKHFEERLDPETGELYQWQPPFQVMSRRPGLGTKAKKHYHSWATYAVNEGMKLSVPRFYKQHYADTATPNEKEDTEYQKYKHALTSHTNQHTEQQLETKERIHYAKQKFHSALRRYE